MRRRFRAKHVKPQNSDPASSIPIDLPGLELVQRFEDAGRAFDIAWSPDGRFLATTSSHLSTADFIVWSADGSLRYRQDRDEPITVMSMAWHPDDSILAIGDDDGKVRLWNADSGESYYLCQPGDEVNGIAWSPDGGQLALTDSTGSVSIWDSGEGVRLRHAQVHGGDVFRSHSCHERSSS